MGWTYSCFASTHAALQAAASWSIGNNVPDGPRTNSECCTVAKIALLHDLRAVPSQVKYRGSPILNNTSITGIKLSASNAQAGA